MVELDALLLCDSVSRDAATGKWILTGVFNVVSAASFPVTHSSMDAFVRVRFDGADRPTDGDRPTLVLACRGPDGDRREMSALPLQVDASGLAEGFLRIQGFPFEQPGVYHFDGLVDGRRVGGTVLSVTQTRQPGETVH